MRLLVQTLELLKRIALCKECNYDLRCQQHENELCILVENWRREMRS